jgi:protocatechuate 3,4-dioxygenase beta subunit
MKWNGLILSARGVIRSIDVLSTRIQLTRKYFLLELLFVLLVSCTHSQPRDFNPHLVGDSCEGCEAVLEYGDVVLSPVDTLPGFDSARQKLKVTGTIYSSDGNTPAEEIILYVYHTDENGVYRPMEGASGWARRHGYRRGWLKTGPDGKYTFYTGMPGAYPNGTEPAHIHITILEPDGKYYWLGSYFFAGDPLLTPEDTEPHNPRGDSPGVMQLKREGKMLVGERHLTLGANIAGYK